MINQDVNPLAGYTAVGATTVGLVTDLESATNLDLDEKDRQEAAREGERKLSLLITDIVIPIAYNAAVQTLPDTEYGKAKEKTNQKALNILLTY